MSCRIKARVVGKRGEKIEKQVVDKEEKGDAQAQTVKELLSKVKSQQIQWKWSGNEDGETKDLSMYGACVCREGDSGLTQPWASSTDIIWPSFHAQTIIHLKWPLKLDFVRTASHSVQYEGMWVEQTVHVFKDVAEP